MMQINTICHIYYLTSQNGNRSLLGFVFCFAHFVREVQDLWLPNSVSFEANVFFTGSSKVIKISNEGIFMRISLNLILTWSSRKKKKSISQTTFVKQKLDTFSGR